MADIRSDGMRQGDVVDALDKITKAIVALAAKLDDDAGVTGEDYEAVVAAVLPANIKP